MWNGACCVPGLRFENQRTTTRDSINNKASTCCALQLFCITHSKNILFGIPYLTHLIIHTQINLRTPHSYFRWSSPFKETNSSNDLQQPRSLPSLSHSPTLSHKETNSPQHSHRNKVFPPSFPSSNYSLPIQIPLLLFCCLPLLFSLLKAIGRVGWMSKCPISFFSGSTTFSLIGKRREKHSDTQALIIYVPFTNQLINPSIPLSNIHLPGVCYITDPVLDTKEPGTSLKDGLIWEGTRAEGRFMVKHIWPECCEFRPESYVPWNPLADTWNTFFRASFHWLHPLICTCSC